MQCVHIIVIYRVFPNYYVCSYRRRDKRITAQMLLDRDISVRNSKVKQANADVCINNVTSLREVTTTTRQPVTSIASIHGQESKDKEMTEVAQV